MQTLKTLLLAGYLLLPIVTMGQDIETTYEQIKERLDGPAFKLSGAIHASVLANYSNTTVRRIDPFAWRLHGQLNLAFYGINIPLSLLTSSKSTVFSYQLPAYHFVGLSPSYKWAKLHVGNSNLNFSPYVFAGHSFSGIGVELRPGIWRVKAMRGKLQRINFKDLGHLQSMAALFSRQAWGIQTGLDTGKDKILLSILKVEDQFNRLPLDSLSSTPMENLVIGLTGRKQISPALYLSVDYGMSFLTRNTLSPIRSNVRPHWLALGLLPFRNSTASHKALKTILGVKTNFGHIEFQHEQVDPGYRSLGTLFFNDDIENITASSTFSAFNKKLKLSTHLGIQRNNLSGLESNSQRRWIGTLNATFLASKALNLNFNFSNFSSTNRLRFSSDPLQVLDSVKLVLVNQQLSLSGQQRLDEEGKSSINAQFSMQQANSIQNEEVQLDQQNSYYLGQISYLQPIGSHPITLSSSLTVNSYQSRQIQNTGICPSLSIIWPLQENKFKWTSTCSYLYQIAAGFPNSQVFNWQQRLSVNWNKKQQLNLQLGLIMRSSPLGGSSASFIESRGRVSYDWRF